MLFAPAPILIFAVGRLSPNLRASMSVLLAGVFVAIAAGISAGVTYEVSFGMAAVLMCYMLERRYSFELIVLVTAGMMLIAGTAAALIAAGSPDAMLTAIHKSLKAGMERGQDFYKAIGMDAGLPADTQATAIDIFIRLSPALAAIAAAATVMLNLTYLLALGRQEAASLRSVWRIAEVVDAGMADMGAARGGIRLSGFQVPDTHKADRDHRARCVLVRGCGVLLPRPRDRVVLLSDAGDAVGGPRGDLRDHLCAAGAGGAGVSRRRAGYVD